MFKSIKNYFLYRQTVNKLSSLTDKELQDFGISRQNIREIAKRSNEKESK